MILLMAPMSGLNCLICGQYVYIFGDTGEDGWYVGELHDGARGFVPILLKKLQ